MPKAFKILAFLLLTTLIASAQQNFFIENKGQWPEDFDYKYLFGNGSVFFNSESITVHLVHPEDLKSNHGSSRVEPKEERRGYSRHHAYRVYFEGAKFNSVHVGGESLETYHNYFLGSDPAMWQSRVPLFQTITYTNIYPNIDLKYYFSLEGNLKYDFIVHPGGNPENIKLRYEGLDDMELVYGNLMLRNSVEDVLESAPYTYQVLAKGKTKVKAEYILEGNEISYKIGKYKKGEDLIIDPKLIFSTFTGSASDNWGYTATPSADGSLYAGGIVFLGSGFYPITMGAFQILKGGSVIDMGISKFSANGSKILYSTYLGGSGNEFPFSLIERQNGELVIMGASGSLNFPVSANAYQPNLKAGTSTTGYAGDSIKFDNGIDLVISILDSSGSILEGSTYFGGHWADGLNIDLSHNYGDDFRGEVLCDSLGQIYVVSSTFSNNLPTTAGVFQNSLQGQQDGFCASFTKNLDTLRWSTYIGGAKSDNALGLAFGRNNNLYVTGGSNSADTIFNKDGYRNFVNDTIGGDGYILNLDRDTGSFISGTYNGTDKRDMNFLIDVDDSGDVYVMGQTRGYYPIDTNEVYHNLGSSQYIHKFSSDLKSSKKAMVFGDGSHAKSNISPIALMVDECRNVYVSGWGGGTNADPAYKYKQGNTNGLPISKNAFQKVTDGQDFYFFILDASWKKINYASYFGGPNGDHVDGGTSRFAKDGTIYQAVCAGCSGEDDFPTTSNAYSRINGSDNCNLAALKIKFETSEVIAKLEADNDSLCVPYTARISNLSYNADVYEWIDAKGNKTNIDIDSVVILDQGPQVYKLIATDTTCGFVDSTELVLYGFKDTLHASFIPDYDSCSNDFSVQMINNSLVADSYEWDFGDGNTSNLKSPLHYYREGTYIIKLITRNSYCLLEDTAEYQITLKKRTEGADFNISYEPCKNGGTPSFKAIGKDFHIYEWDFGDGLKAEGETVSHEFEKDGSYHVKLTLKDTLCNRIFERDTMMDVFLSGYSPDIPNVFTPDGDGVNDYFGLADNVPKSYYKGFNMQVYNRWGTLLYETNDINSPWDGSQDARPMAEAVYFYRINLTDGCNTETEHTGFVHLMKSK